MTEPKLPMLDKLVGHLDALHGRTIDVTLRVGSDLADVVDARLAERERLAAMDERMNWE